MDNINLRAKAIEGINWNVLEQILDFIIFFIVTAILSRILTPKEFGLIAMIGVFTGFANFFLNLGFPSALIQRKEINDDHLNTIFWINLGVGGLIFIFFIVFAQAISNFYNQPALVSLIYLMASIYIIESFNMVQTAILTRQMNFKILSLRRVIANLLAGTIAIILALNDFREWSLAWRAVFTSAFVTLLIWFYGKWRPKFKFRLKALKELSNYSFNLFGVNLITYVMRNADNLLVGKIMGDYNLGIYNRAYSLMLMPVKNLGRVIGNVMFPTLSRIQEDKKRFKTIYLNSVMTISFLTAPIMIMITALAETFIKSVYGNQWIETIPILQILALVGYLHSIISTIGWIYQASGRTDLQFKITTLVSIILLLALFAAILTKDLMNVAYTYAIIYSILFYPQIRIATKIIDTKFSELFIRILPSLIIALLTGSFVYFLSKLSIYRTSNLFHFIILFILGLIFYVILNHLFDTKAWEYFKIRFLELLRKKQ